MKREFNTFKHNYDLEEEGRNISYGVRRGAFGIHICPAHMFCHMTNIHCDVIIHSRLGSVQCTCCVEVNS